MIFLLFKFRRDFPLDFDLSDESELDESLFLLFIFLSLLRLLPRPLFSLFFASLAYEPIDGAR